MSCILQQLRRFVLVTVLGGMTIMLPGLASAFPVCDPATNPNAETFCDLNAHPENFSGDADGQLCVAEPAPGTPGIQGTGICISGQVTPLETLIVLFAEVNFDGAPVAQPPRVNFDPNALTDGSFIDSLILPALGSGTYTVMVNALFIGSLGVPHQVNVSRQVIVIDEPDLGILSAEVKNRDEDLSSGIIRDDTGTTLTSNTLSARTMNLCVGSSGDTTGSEVTITVTNDITTPEGNIFSLDRSCPAPEDLIAPEDAAELCPSTPSCGPGQKLDTSTCLCRDVFCGRSSACNVNGSNGFLVSGIPLGHGTNDLEVIVENAAGTQLIDVQPFENDLKPLELCVQFYDQDGNLLPQVDGRPVRSDRVSEMTAMLLLTACPATIPAHVPAAERSCDFAQRDPDNDVDHDGIYDVDDPDNDNDGVCDLPACVDDPATSVNECDGQPLPGDTATCQLICDLGNIENCEGYFKFVEVGDCRSPSQVLCTYQAAPPTVNGARAFVQKANELLPIAERQDATKLQRKRYEMCRSRDDDRVFLFHLGSEDLQFPLGSVTFDAEADGFQASKTVSFGYGRLHSMFTDKGVLITSEVDEALAGFLPREYLEVTEEGQGGLVDVIERAANSAKFKDELFLDLFKPQAPTRDIIESCEFIGPEVDRFRAFQIFDPVIGNIDVTSLRLLNNNRLWLQLHIDELRGYTEIFSVQCDKADCEGLDIVDEQLQGAKFVADADFGVGILPLELAIDDLVSNVEIQLSKDAEGKTVTQVRPIPGYPLLDVRGKDSGRLVKFRCDISQSRMKTRDGNSIWIDTPACKDLAELNAMLNSEGLEPKKDVLNVSQQLVKTIENQLSCQTPKQLTDFLADFEKDPLLQLNLPIFGVEFSTEIFADLLKADLNFSPWGLSFQGGSLVLPAGTFPEGAPTEGRNSKGFMASLPAELKTDNFGFLSDPTDQDDFDAIGAAMSLGKEMNLMLKEEMVNMVLQSVNILMFDLLQEDNQPDFADLNDKAIIEKFEFGAFVDSENCFKLNADGLLEAVPQEDEVKNCFVLRLRPFQIFGTNVLDFDGDGSVSDEENNLPLRLRIGMNRFLPPMVKFLGSSTTEGPTGRPETILLKIKIALSDLAMSIFEDEQLDPDPERNLRRQLDEGVEPRIISWCERYPMASPDCQRGVDVPIVQLRLDGEVTLWVEYTPEAVDGKIKTTGGFKPRLMTQADGSLKVVPDQEASYLNVSMKQNNTPYADGDLVGAMLANLNETALNFYLFGADSAISLDLPAVLPEDASCENSDANNGDDEDLFDLLNDFGFESIGLEDPIIVFMSSSPRYLGIGFDPIFNECGAGGSQ